MHHPSKKSGCYLNFLPFRLSDAPIFWKPGALGDPDMAKKYGLLWKNAGAGMCFDWNGSNHLKWLLEKSPKIMLFNVKTADVQIDSWQHHVEPTESGMSNIQKKTFRSEKNKKLEKQAKNPTNTIRIQKKRVCNHQPSKGENLDVFQTSEKAPHLPPWLAHNTSVHDTIMRPLGLASWGAHGWLRNLFNPGGVLFLVGKRSQKKIETTRPSF